MLLQLAALSFVATVDSNSVGDNRSRSLRVTSLTCEHLSDPNCIDALHPRLGWISNTSSRNWKQSAYRIVVSSTLRGSLSFQGDRWDTGKVLTDQSNEIPYDGKPLTSNQGYFWRVQVIGSDGSSEWSDPSSWQEGLLDPTAWGNSKWIGNGKSGAAPYLRREFKVTSRLRRARLFACGLGYAELHLNGSKLGKGSERDPGYTNFDKTDLYVAHDITSLLKPGPNAIGAILGTGWYDVHDLATWRFEKAPWRDRPKLRLLIALEYEDGRTEQVVSDESWKVSTGPILDDGIYSGEVYDARREMPGWDRPRYPAPDWVSATILNPPKGRLAALSCPSVRVTETIEPVSIKPTRPGVFLVDFGQNISGHVLLTLRGKRGDKVEMLYSERADATGKIDRSQIDTYMTKTNPPQSFQRDIYICKGHGQETWEQAFSYSGFRYVEVSGFPGTPGKENFRARFAHTDLPSVGAFSCSNDLLNKIQKATVYSYLSNAQSILTDCPQREKNGWTGDAGLAAEAGLMNFKTITLDEKWLGDLADDQKENGRLSLIVPSDGWGSNMFNPAWDSTYPILIEDLFKYTGDQAMIARHYEGCKKYVDALETQSVKGVIAFDSLGDWLPWDTQTPSQLTSTAFLYLDQTLISEFAKKLGRDDESKNYLEKALATKEAFNREFFDQKSGTYANGSQAALSTALYFGLVPEDFKSKVFNQLVQNVERQGHIDTGIIGAKNVLRVLSEGGRTDLAYQIVARKEQPGWGWWIGQGATTLWEDWKGESSLNHIMFGDVSNWFYQWIAGIGLDPSVPGFKHILIRPQAVGDLTWAKATYDSPYGEISSSWQRNGSTFELSLTIPPNVSATVMVPGKSPVEVGSGRYHFTSSGG